MELNIMITERESTRRFHPTEFGGGFIAGEARGTLMGVKIYVSTAHSPRFALSKDVPVSPDFRKQFEAWAAEFFGVHWLIPDGQVHQAGQNAMFMNPNTFAEVKRSADKIGKMVL
jgi:hypothetical protein